MEQYFVNVYLGLYSVEVVLWLACSDEVSLKMVCCFWPGS